MCLKNTVYWWFPAMTLALHQICGAGVSARWRTHRHDLRSVNGVTYDGVPPGYYRRPSGANSDWWHALNYGAKLFFVVMCDPFSSDVVGGEAMAEWLWASWLMA